MIDQLLREAEQKYRQGQRYYQAQAAAPALAHYHDALESLLRWCLIRDGAPPARVTDPQQVTWQDLVDYLDARYGVERQACMFLSQMTHLRVQIAAGGHPELNTLTMQGYTHLVQSLFRRFFPRSSEEREAVAQRGTFGRPRPLADLTAMPPERRGDTPIMVPTQPPPAIPPPIAAATAPPLTSRPLWAEQLLHSDPNLSDSPHLPASLPPQEEEMSATQNAAATPTPFPPQEERTSLTQNAELRSRNSVPAPAPTAELRTPNSAQSAEQRAREAGQRLREMRMNGLEYCPRCRNTITMTSSTCPYCKFDMVEFRAFSRRPVDARGGLLGKILRRRR